jgi:hypothetical protein
MRVAARSRGLFVLSLLLVSAVLAVQCRETQSAEAQVEAVRGLVARLLGPQLVASFDLALVDPQPNTGNDVFRLLPSSTIDG